MIKLKLCCKAALFLAAALLFSVTCVFSQEKPDYSDTYLTPPESISEEILAPDHLNVTLDGVSPHGSYFLNRKRNGITPLSNFAKPCYNIAGLQIDHQANRSRSLTTQRATTGLELVNTRTGERIELDTPDNVTISNPKWSPDGRKIAWLGHTSDETNLFVTDIEDGSTRQVSRRPLLATLNTDVFWAVDSRNIFTILIPERRGNEPVRPATPVELKVRTTSDGENRLRTYPDLLEDSFEGELLEYYITGQLVRIDTQNRRTRNIGSPAMIRSIDAAPSGEHVIVQSLQKPFSYIVPLFRFSWSEEIWDINGEVLVTLRKSDVNDGVPDEDAVENFGRNDIKWRPDGDGLSLIFKPEEKEEEDDDPESEEDNSEEEQSDKENRIIRWVPPFGDDDMNVIFESEQDLNTVRYSEDGTILFVTENKSGDEHLFAHYTGQPDTSYTIYRYDPDDFYDNPGNLSLKPGEMGVSSVRISDDGDSVFLTGIEYFEDVEEDAPRPYIDRVDIRTGEKERVFQSSEEYYESISSILDNNAGEIIFERESATDYPDYYHRDLSSGNTTQLTENTDYNEKVSQAYRDRFIVKRADGIEFWVDVVIPSGWEGEALAGLIWHYPREYDDQEDYNESLRRYNKNSFPNIAPRTPDILVKEGYAVLKPDWPITGSRGTSNDNFVWSVVQNSTALIDSAEARGYIDRDKLAIGGHSYGAFGTANAMIHTSFFKAGIAGSGNYNRTLTPLGFQRERSDLWRGMDRYLQMSPIFWADRLDGAFLMYHGEEDQNVGTWPVNSDRMFHALNGLNKTAVLYKYPYEAHGPAAEETLLDMWKRWSDWLDVHVKEL